MTAARQRINEAACLDALYALNVLDSAPEAEFDAVVKAAAALCGTPISLISLIDRDRQWFKANIGLSDLAETARDVAFCAHAVLQEGGLFEVRDASSDPRFASNPLVTGPLKIRYYAGAPVRLRDNTCVGTLCVIDAQPRQLNDVQRDALLCLSRTVAHALEGRQAIQQTLVLATELAEKHELLQLTLLSVADAVLTADMDGNVTFLNPVAERLTGWTMSAALGQRLAEVFLPTTKDRESGDTSIGADVLIARDGQDYAIETSVAPIKKMDGRPVGEIWVFRDVTQQRRSLEQMRYQATHDALTGLVNRTVFDVRLENAVQSAHEAQSNHALMYVDLDQFKLVNDSCGHAAGDKLLKEIARILTEAVRPTDVVARLGGDEFAVLIENCTNENAQLIAQGFCQRMDELRFSHGSQRFRIGASVGLVPVTNAWSTAAAALQAADASCYAAKEAGRNRVHAWFDTDLAVKTRQEQVRWAALIEQAIDQDRFVLYAQKISPLGRQQHGLHAEVLLRMVSQDGLLIAPGIFLPAAERFNLIVRIDRWVLRRTIAVLRETQSADYVETFNVNLSGRSVGDPAFHAWAHALFRDAGPHLCAKLCLEITETSAIGNFPQAAAFIEEARALGLRVALDDFGSGAASFGYLKQLKIDYLKIDGQFVRGLLTDALDDAAVQCFVNVAKVLGIKTVAEFVENPEVLSRLEAMGVDFAQGFFIHRPAPIESVLHHYMVEIEALGSRERLAPGEQFPGR